MLSRARGRCLRQQLAVPTTMGREPAVQSSRALPVGSEPVLLFAPAWWVGLLLSTLQKGIV